MEVERAQGLRETDWVAVEEPLEIRLDGQPLAVTLRTPGHDRELAAGFLYSEGVIANGAEIAALERASREDHPQAGNVLFVRLIKDARAKKEHRRQARREFVAAAACGLCGKEKLEDLYRDLPPIKPFQVPAELVRRLPARMRSAQELFELTGGIHAAALFNGRGELLCLREDIGRHNAIDKVIGHYVLRGEVPLEERVLVSSGRAGFEIVQKARVAAVPVLATVGAASSLAVELAAEGGMTLYSFVGKSRSNHHL